jgi:hypothetical protein
MRLIGGRSGATRRSLALAACLALGALALIVTASRSASASAAPPLGRSVSAASGFAPLSVTFVSLRRAWALGTAPCTSAGACLELRESTDAGRSWLLRPLPAALLAAAERRVSGAAAALNEATDLNVRFADASNGWIYGGLATPAREDGYSYVASEPTLWSTHDGGSTWHAQSLHALGSEGALLDVETAAGEVYLLQRNGAATVEVEVSPVAHDSWRRARTPSLEDPAGGAEQSGAFVLQGATGWLVEGNDRGTTGSARLTTDGQWVNWTPPCAAVGHSFAIPAASTPRNLVALCTMGGFAYPLSKSAPPGATLGSVWLYFSSNAGASFEAGPELRLPARAQYFGGPIASPSPGVVLLPDTAQNGPSALVASFDRGLHWSIVYHGDVDYLAFTSPSQGFAIIGSQSSTATRMIMTFDGGRRWQAVTF